MERYRVIATRRVFGSYGPHWKAACRGPSRPASRELAKLRPNSGWPKFHDQPCRVNLEVGWERPGPGERATPILLGEGTGRPFPG